MNRMTKNRCALSPREPTKSLIGQSVGTRRVSTHGPILLSSRRQVTSLTMQASYLYRNQGNSHNDTGSATERWLSNDITRPTYTRGSPNGCLQSCSAAILAWCKASWWLGEGRPTSSARLLERFLTDIRCRPLRESLLKSPYTNGSQKPRLLLVKCIQVVGDHNCVIKILSCIDYERTDTSLVGQKQKSSY
jgi:hypothetical protein